MAFKGSRDSLIRKFYDGNKQADLIGEMMMFECAWTCQKNHFYVDPNQKWKGRPLSFEDFSPGLWTDDSEGPYRFFHAEGVSKPELVIDMRTGMRQSKGVFTARTNNVLYAIGTPIVYTLAAVTEIAVRMFRILSGYHFWKKEASLSFRANLQKVGNDFFKTIILPIALVGMEFSALYGVFMPYPDAPYDGFKFHQSFERLGF